MKTGHHLAKYACFGCRKCFKRPGLYSRAAGLVPRGKPLETALAELEATHKHACPQCCLVMRFVGQTFKAPKISDVRTWQRLESLYAQRSDPLLDSRWLCLRHDDLWYAYGKA